MLFAGLGSVRMVKNCDLGPENAALGVRPRAAFSSPRSQFFTIRTSQPANNIYYYIQTEIFLQLKMIYLNCFNKYPCSFESFLNDLSLQKSAL